MGKNNRSNAERLEHIKFLMDGNLIQLRKGQETFNDFKWLVEHVEHLEMRYENTGAVMGRQNMQSKINQLEKEIAELKSEVIGVALYETKILHEKLQPEQHSSIGRQFKHIINTLENKTEGAN